MRVVEIVPARPLDVAPAVVEVPPFLVVEINPALVVAMVPGFAATVPETVTTISAVPAISLRFFMVLLLIRNRKVSPKDALTGFLNLFLGQWFSKNVPSLTLIAYKLATYVSGVI